MNESQRSEAATNSQPAVGPHDFGVQVIRRALPFFGPPIIRLTDARGHERTMAMLVSRRRTREAEFERAIGRVTAVLLMPAGRLFITIGLAMLAYFTVHHFALNRLVYRSPFAQTGSPSFVWLRWVLLLVLLWAIMEVLAAVVRAHLRRAAPHAISQLLREAYCPDCLYPVRGLPADESHAVQCPECGAAWPAAHIAPMHSTPQSQTVGAEQSRTSGSISDRLHRALVLAKRGRDDRGTQTAFVRSSLHRERSAASDARVIARMADAAAAARRPSRIVRWLIAAAIVAAICAFLMFMHISLSRAGGNHMLMLIQACTAGAFTVYLVALTFISDWGVSTDQLRAQLLKRALCPSCAHDLSDAPRSDDGCIECPRCAAAWRIGGFSA